MGQRMLRTRTKIANAAIAFRVPEPHRLAERTTGVLAVIYLIFNEGYAVTEGEGTADALVAEAVRLAGLVVRLAGSGELPDIALMTNHERPSDVRRQREASGCSADRQTGMISMRCSMPARSPALLV